MLGKIVELLSVNASLSTSRPYIQKLLSLMVILMLVGAFATVLAAMVVGFGLLLIFANVLAAGYSVPGAAAAALAVFVAILVIAAIVALRIWAGMTRTLQHIVDVNTPPAARAVDGVTTVAGSFVSGLLGARRRARKV